jgi:hypothetical protein
MATNMKFLRFRSFEALNRIRPIGFLPLFFNFGSLVSLFAQGTAFTYQGRLENSSGPANGLYDVRFTIYDSTNNPGTLIAGPLTNSATPVSNGLFTVTLDFGAVVFTGPTVGWKSECAPTATARSQL